MRIALLSPVYRGGGAERCARELFEQLMTSGEDVRMLVARRSKTDPSRVIPVRYPGEKYLRALERLGVYTDARHLGSIRTLARLTPDNLDVAHLHNLHGGWISVRAVKRLCRRVPTVWTLHDEWAPTAGVTYDLERVLDAEGIKRWVGPRSVRCEAGDRQMRRLLQSEMPRPDALVVPSQYMGDLVRDSGRFEGVPVHRIPYGLSMLARAEIDADRAECRRELGIAADARVVLLVAANFGSPFKGMSLAADALPRLGNCGVTLLIVGTGGEEMRARVGLPVICTGFVSDERRLARIYRAADVTLVPSVADNFPYVVLESMACATPVVAFRIGGLVEMLGEVERGLLTRAFDTCELAANLKVILDCADLRARLGNAGRAWVRIECDTRQYLDRHLQLYRHVCSRFDRHGECASRGWRRKEETVW
jgi:glycosyltransferase involved in cell wall biosynthesis